MTDVMEGTTPEEQAKLDKAAQDELLTTLEQPKYGKNDADTLTFTVPDNAPSVEDRGKEIRRAFAYVEVDNVADAQQVIVDKGWNLVELVNRKLKQDARSAVYQAEMVRFKPSTVSPDEIRERTIRDLMRLGIPENVARAQVDGMLSAQNG